MVDRTDRDVHLARIQLKHLHMYNEKADIAARLPGIIGGINYMEESPVKGALLGLYYCITDINMCFHYYLDSDGSYDPIQSIPYFLEHHTIAEAGEGEEYELTWEKIVNVWITSDAEGQKWTIGMIDYMRKVIWDKPFKFPLIPAGQWNPQ